MILRLRTAAAGLLLLSVLAACSAAGAAPSGVASLASQGADGAAEPSASLAPEDAILAFTECMRDEGIDMPDPEPNGGGGAVALGASGEGQEAFQAAMEACDEFLQQAQSDRAEIDPEQMDRMLEFAGCMRDHGIPMPDPNTDGEMTIERTDGGTVTNGDVQLDPSSPEFQQAQEACQPILGDDIVGPQTQIGPGGDSGGRVDIATETANP